MKANIYIVQCMPRMKLSLFRQRTTIPSHSDDLREVDDHTQYGSTFSEIPSVLFLLLFAAPISLDYFSVQWPSCVRGIALSFQYDSIFSIRSRLVNVGNMYNFSSSSTA